jgi:death-on-curing protein
VSVLTQDFLAALREKIAEFHDFTIREHGGLPIFRDKGFFEHAVARPWMTAFGEPAYETPFLKAAAIAEAIARGHPFNDGNHRTALAAAHIVLGLFDLITLATDSEMHNAIMKLGGGVLSLEDFSAWLERKCALRPRPN